MRSLVLAAVLLEPPRRSGHAGVQARGLRIEVPVGDRGDPIAAVLAGLEVVPGQPASELRQGLRDEEGERDAAALHHPDLRAHLLPPNTTASEFCAG